MPMGPMGPAGLQVELSAASSSSSSDGEGPWGTGSGASQALCPGGRGAAAGAQAAGAPAAGAQPGGGGSSAPAGAQGRAALFEALVRANTETVITVRAPHRHAQLRLKRRWNPAAQGLACVCLCGCRQLTMSAR